MIGKIWDFLKIKFKDKLYIFSFVSLYAALFTLFPQTLSQLPPLLLCLVFIILMAIVLAIEIVGNLKEMVLMLLKEKINLPVPEEIADLAKSMGVTCKTFKIVTNYSNAGVLPTGSVLIGDKLFSELSMHELLAVFAHEFGHHKKRHYYLKLSAFFLFFVTGYVLFHNLPEFMMWYGLFAFTSIVMIPISWHLEIEADRMGKTFVGANYMITALEKISVNRDPNEPSETHPSINARIRMLKTSQ